MENIIGITIIITMGENNYERRIKNMEYVTRTTNTVTMNTDCAYLKHNHRDPETIGQVPTATTAS